MEDLLLIGATVFGSFVDAFVLQKAALKGFFRIMGTERRARR